MEAAENKYEWVSISTLAKRLGFSDQTIRNRVKEGFYETLNFKRGKLNGILIKVKRCQDKNPNENASVVKNVAKGTYQPT